MAQTYTKLTTATATAAPSKLPPPLFTFVLIIILCIIGYYTVLHPHSSNSIPQNTTLQHHNTFLSSSSNYTISHYLRDLTAHPHLAGTEPSLDTAHYVYSHFKQLNLDPHTVNYKALLSYPAHASLQVHFDNGSFTGLSLTEKGVSNRDVVQPYHAYSPSGSVHAKAVFVNYGREEDYRVLEAMGVNVSGCVVIARKGDSLPRIGIIAVAESNGALGVLLYAEGDRLRDGGVERGTVMRGIGDPLTPGWAGVEGGESLDLEDNEVLKRFPKIPSLPLSLETAHFILGSLGGGLVPHFWNDSGLVSAARVGPGPTMVNLTYQVDVALTSSCFSLMYVLVKCCRESCVL